MKKYALVLCATLWAFGVGAVATAQGAQASAGAAPSGALAPGAGTTGALGNAQAVDETTLTIGTQGATQTQSGLNGAGPNTTVYFLRMVLVLALVLGLIYLVFRIMKRVSKPKVASDSELKILASTSLGQGRAVHVIGVGSKAYLVGATDSAVSLIAEVEDKELIDELELKAATEPPKAKTDFAAIFTSLLGKGGKPVGKAKSSRVDSFSPEYLAQQRERLKKF